MDVLRHAADVEGGDDRPRLDSACPQMFAPAARVGAQDGFGNERGTEAHGNFGGTAARGALLGALGSPVGGALGLSGLGSLALEHDRPSLVAQELAVFDRMLLRVALREWHVCSARPRDGYPDDTGPRRRRPSVNSGGGPPSPFFGAARAPGDSSPASAASPSAFQLPGNCQSPLSPGEEASLREQLARALKAAELCGAHAQAVARRAGAALEARHGLATSALVFHLWASRRARRLSALRSLAGGLTTRKRLVRQVAFHFWARFAADGAGGAAFWEASAAAAIAVREAPAPEDAALAPPLGPGPRDEGSEDGSHRGAAGMQKGWWPFSPR